MSNHTKSLRRAAAGVALAAAAMLAVVGCTPSANSNTSPTDGAASNATLVYAFTNGGVTLDPTESSQQASNAIIKNTYDQLIQWKVEDGKAVAGEYVPDLAESWETSDDQLTWTFHLRTDVKFNGSGDTMTAKDVAFSIMRKQNAASSTLFRLAKIASVEVVDDATVAVHLTGPQPDLLAYFVIHNFAIQDSAAVATGAGVDLDAIIAGKGDADTASALKEYMATEDAAKLGLGTGPYTVESWDPTTQAVLVANPDYWGGAPTISRVVIKFIPEMSTQISQVEQGDIDIVYGAPPSTAEELSSQSNLTVTENPSGTSWYLGLNNKVAPFDDADVRRALAYAIDYDSVVETALYGHGAKATSPIPDSMPYSDPSTDPYSYDPDKATQLLAAAGYDASHPLSFTAVLNTSYQPEIDAATVIQQNLKAIGVDMQIQQLANSEYTTAVQPTDSNPDGPQAMFHQWASYVNTPSYHLGFLLESTGSWNVTHYDNQQVDDLIAKAALEDGDAAQADWSQVQTLIAQDSPWLYLFMDDTIVAMNNKVGGFVQYLDTLPHFAEMSITE